MSERRKSQCGQYRKVFISHMLIGNFLPKRYYGFGARKFRITLECQAQTSPLAMERHVRQATRSDCAMRRSP
jgi:hypothetical protein